MTIGFLDTARRPLGHGRGPGGVASLGAFAAIVPVEKAGSTGTATEPRGFSGWDDRLVLLLERELLDALRPGTPRDGAA